MRTGAPHLWTLTLIQTRTRCLQADPADRYRHSQVCISEQDLTCSSFLLCAEHHINTSPLIYSTVSYFPAQEQPTDTNTHVNTASLQAYIQRGTEAGQTINRLNLISSHLFLRKALFHIKPPGAYESDPTWNKPSWYKREDECCLHEEKMTGGHFSGQVNFMSRQTQKWEKTKI